VVRLTGDCPLIDPETADRVIEYHLVGYYDYTRNKGYPDGLDVEVMRINALNEAFRFAKSPYDREHVTPYLYNNPDKYRVGYLENYPDYSHLKLSVDTEEDFVRVSKVIEACLNSTLEILRDY